MDSLMKKAWSMLGKKKYIVPALSGILIGLLTHFPVLINRFPNSDSMANFYFDQNMITSGRWFLTVACGISSYYDLGWLIGVLSIVYIAVAAVFVCEFFEIRSLVNRGLIAALLVTFPAICATFSYMYTMDGYMIGLILAVLAAYVTKRYRYGFVPGAFCLAFCLGIYQAYLAVTILLCIFYLIIKCLENKKIAELWSAGWRFLVMGISGGALYMGILKILLAIQGKELDSYQGIDEMGSFSAAELPGLVAAAVKDFGAFALKGNILINNGFSLVAVVLLVVVAICAALFCFAKIGGKRRYINLLFILVFAAMLPVATNVVMIVSAEAYYHLLMRLQWVMYPVFAVVLTDAASGYVKSIEKDFLKTKAGRRYAKGILAGSIVTFLSAAGLSYCFLLMDNIAYFNMNERYEKTYAYCLRLLDRMEETPGYEPGMPVAMIGVVNEENYPNTDITTEVTDRISGTGGSILIYKGEQYAAFMKHYMNVTFETIEGDALIEIYQSEEYRQMDSFPAANSMQVVDGILYVKTEAKE